MCGRCRSPRQPVCVGAAAAAAGSGCTSAAASACCAPAQAVEASTTPAAPSPVAVLQRMTPKTSAGSSGTQALTAEANAPTLAKPHSTEAVAIHSLCDPASSIGRSVAPAAASAVPTATASVAPWARKLTQQRNALPSSGRPEFAAEAVSQPHSSSVSRHGTVILAGIGTAAQLTEMFEMPAEYPKLYNNVPTPSGGQQRQREAQCV